jgi:hypothetical protein
VIRGVLALFCASLAIATSITASGITARNHARALGLHELQRECELRTASIEAKSIQVRGFLVDDSNRVQDGGVVSGSLNPGGSHTASSGVSKVSLSGLRYTP